MAFLNYPPLKALNWWSEESRMNPLLPLIYVQLLTIIERFLYTVSIPNFLNSGAKRGRLERFRNDAHRLLLQLFRLFALHHFGCHEDD